MPEIWRITTENISILLTIQGVYSKVPKTPGIVVNTGVYQKYRNYL